MMTSMKNSDAVSLKIFIWVFGISFGLVASVFGALETRKVDKSVFDLHIQTERQQRAELMQRLDKIETKLDQILMMEKEKEKGKNR